MTACTHYNRNCSFITPCCNKIYGCRHCHNEIEGNLIETVEDIVNNMQDEIVKAEKANDENAKTLKSLKNKK